MNTGDRKRGWEAAGSAGLLAIYFLSRPPLISSRTPYLLQRPVLALALDPAILATAFGLAVSATRGGHPLRRLFGAGCLVISIAALLGWLYLLLNWWPYS